MCFSRFILENNLYLSENVNQRNSFFINVHQKKNGPLVKESNMEDIRCNFTMIVPFQFKMHAGIASETQIILDSLVCVPVELALGDCTPLFFLSLFICVLL